MNKREIIFNFGNFGLLLAIFEKKRLKRDTLNKQGGFSVVILGADFSNFLNKTATAASNGNGDLSNLMLLLLNRQRMYHMRVYDRSRQQRGLQPMQRAQLSAD